LLGACIGGHDQHDIAEISFTTVGIGQLTVIHDLQQYVVHIRMGFLDFIEQQYRVRVAGNGLGQQTTLVETNVTRGCPNQAGYRMCFHVFRHIKAYQLNTHDHG